ncbi:acyl-CoA dehydrogenase family protein [Paraburkholderia sp. BR10882]|uniref:acyl-CoA dehydrogenase family protein n=1 Tax=unclassified Paraburkholderia TaxID=2615204 RepID=UPI0034CD94DC
MTETSALQPGGIALVSPLSAALGFSEAIIGIAATAAQREREQRLPHEEIATLKALGFGALRLPADDGGRGLSLSELFAVARDVAAADSNIAHALRNHFWQVEAALKQRALPFHAHVLDLVRQRKTIGLSFVESDATAAGARPSRVLSRLEWDERKQVYLGSGDKVYATGNLYNDAFIGVAVESRANTTVQYVLERAEGVSDEDDWLGFGQRLTGSGTARFRDVVVKVEHVYAPDPPKAPEAAPWGFTFHQIYLTNCIAGIVRRVVLDAVEVLRGRKRNFYHGGAAHPADEPALQALLGRIRAYAASIEASADRAVRALQRALDSEGTNEEYAATLAATLAASEAKVVIDDLAPQVASWLIDLGSGSVVSSVGALDRHWRNIKVIASHNPRLYKERLLGQNLLTGQLPPTGAFF